MSGELTEVENAILKNLWPVPEGTYMRLVVVHDCRYGMDTLVVEGDDLVLYTCEPPVRGRDVAAAYRLLKQSLGLHDRHVEIVHGERGRVKVLLVRSQGRERVFAGLRERVREDMRRVQGL